MAVHTKTTAGTTLALELGPAFRAEDASRLHELIAAAAPGTRVEIDFRRVRDCHAVALLLLARDLLEAGAHVAVHGMSHHQRRLLGYLGVPGADVPEAVP
jgi:hypothetical protein